MAKIALGQSKMVRRPLSGFLHLIVYLGFIIINIEVLEIVIDGLFGTHRIFAPIMGPFYGIFVLEPKLQLYVLPVGGNLC